MARLTVILALCVVVALVALGYTKRKANQALAAKTSTAQAAQPLTKPGAASAPAILPAADSDNAIRPIGFGLTYGLVTDPKLSPDTASLSCQGEPGSTERPGKEACNPIQGDTSCRTVLPVLCVRPGTAPSPAKAEAGLYPAWTGGTLGGTAAVMGAILESEAAGHAACEKELGQDWRMAEFKDGAQGGSLQGLRSLGLSPNNRYWVLSRGHAANCWNSKP